VSVLVTGGAGYIGSHTVRALRRRSRDVVVLDSLEMGHRQAVPSDVPLVVGDIADADLVARTVEEHGVTAAIHFAALKAAGESMENPARYFANNVGKSNTLLDSLRLGGVDRFVFSSTCAVYGTPTKLPVSEDHALGPESPYGESKRMVEQMLDWYDTCHGLRSVKLRYFNAAGAAGEGDLGEDWTVTLNLVPLVMKAALGRIPKVTVFGTDYPTRDGTAIRDYIHVDDLAEAHVLALDHLDAGGKSEALNLGTGVGSTVQEVIDTACRVSGVDIPVEYAGRRLGDPESVFGDNHKAGEVLGWRPDRNLDNIMSSAWQWHSTHPDGFTE
jgi:UDP-glucose 4-epimerase